MKTTTPGYRGKKIVEVFCPENFLKMKLITSKLQEIFNLEASTKLALDVASSEFYKDNLYHIDSEGLKLNSEEMCNFLLKLVKDYTIVSIEDGMDQNDWEGWKYLTQIAGG